MHQLILFSVPGFDAVAAPGLDPVQKTAGEMHHMMHLSSSLLRETWSAFAMDEARFFLQIQMTQNVCSLCQVSMQLQLQDLIPCRRLLERCIM